jgi:hypothetical protein
MDTTKVTEQARGKTVDRVTSDTTGDVTITFSDGSYLYITSLTYGCVAPGGFTCERTTDIYFGGDES